MTKIAVLGDTHWGIRNDSSIFHDHMAKFLDQIFFPYLEENDIKHIIHIGDLVDRRKYINFNTARRLQEDFLSQVYKREMSMHIIVGNHDVYYKNTNETNVLKELNIEAQYKFPCYTSAETITVDGVDILLVPWICPENRERTLEEISKSKAQICMGHLELEGFEMHKGTYNTHGDSMELFERFEIVLSGHYHTRSRRKNIHYIGAPSQFNWLDYEDVKGFCVLDTSSREVTYVNNPIEIFKKVRYDDSTMTVDDIANVDFRNLEGCYVKLIVRNKMNPYWFSLFTDKLEKSGLSDLQIVEDHFHSDLEADQDIFSESEGTVSILKKHVKGLELDKERNEKVDKIIVDLYLEAQSVV